MIIRDICVNKIERFNRLLESIPGLIPLRLNHFTLYNWITYNSVLHPTEPVNFTDSYNAFNNIYNYNLEEHKTNAR